MWVLKKENRDYDRIQTYRPKELTKKKGSYRGKPTTNILP